MDPFIVKDELQKDYSDPERVWTVYIHTVPKEVRSSPERDDYYDKYYVGITSIGINRRWRTGGKGYSGQKRFWSAIKKYGWENFTHEIIAEHLTFKEASYMEKTLIKELDSYGKHGYNNSFGGDSLGLYIDISGKKYDHLTVLYKDETKEGDYWICECDCESHNKVSRSKRSLLSKNHEHMCDECRKNRLKENNKNNIKYQDKNKNIYNLWIDIKKRANSNNVSIYKEWVNNYMVFQTWCLENNYVKGLCLIRINDSKGYDPNNCKFVEKGDVSKNQIGKHGQFYTYNGMTMNKKQWAKFLDIPYNVFKARVKKMSFEKAVTLPYKPNTRKDVKDYE